MFINEQDLVNQNFGNSLSELKIGCMGPGPRKHRFTHKNSLARREDQNRLKLEIVYVDCFMAK